MANLIVRYFAILREQAGTESERISTSAPNSAALYDEIRARHGFSLPASALRVAINNEFASMEMPLSEGDEVAFIAPVAGG